MDEIEGATLMVDEKSKWLTDKYWVTEFNFLPEIRAAAYSAREGSNPRRDPERGGTGAPRGPQG